MGIDCNFSKKHKRESRGIIKKIKHYEQRKYNMPGVRL